MKKDTPKYTKLEYEVARLLMEGNKSAEIARILNKPIGTVKAAYWRIRWKAPKLPELKPREVENGNFAKALARIRRRKNPMCDPMF